MILILVFLMPLGVFSQEQKINTSKDFRFEDFNITLKVLIVSVEELEILENFGEILSFDGETAILKAKRDKTVELSKLGFKIKELSKRVTYKTELTTIHLSSNNSSDRTSITKMIAKVSNSTVTSYLQDLQDFRTRHSYTNNSTLAAEYIASKFNQTGLEVEYDFFIYNNYSMRNVIGTIPGSSKNSSIFIISAHYDSWSPQWESIAPGADDDASGVAALIEAARILIEYDFNSTLKFIAFSGEEQGLWGSKHYAEEAFYNNDSIVGVINFDMIGYNDNFSKIDIIGNPESEWLVELMNSINSEYNLGIMINKIIDPNIWYGDHSSFWDNGYNAILGIEDIRPWDSNPFYKANP
ncbi:MAG: M28 family metallopeptidase [Methanosarcinales archaeon]